MRAIAQAQLIDHYNTDDLFNYYQTIVLARGADPAFAFGITSSPAGTLQVSQSSFSSGAQQDLILRNDDYSLGVRQTLRVERVSLAQNTGYSDFGLPIMYAASPAAVVWTSGTQRTRRDVIDVYVKQQYSTPLHLVDDLLSKHLYSAVCGVIRWRRPTLSLV